MKAKFTKGEWVADYGTVTCGDVAVADCELNSLEYTPTEEANAHLIAAAPDMYNHIQHDIDRLKSTYGCFSGLHLKQIKEEVDRKESLLAKARG